MREYPEVETRLNFLIKLLAPTTVLKDNAVLPTKRTAIWNV